MMKLQRGLGELFLPLIKAEKSSQSLEDKMSERRRQSETFTFPTVRFLGKIPGEGM